MRAVGEAWNRFWFQPTSTAALGLLRIAFGLLVVLWTVSLTPDVLELYGAGGLAPSVELPAGQLGLLDGDSPDWLVISVVAALLVAAICTALGYHARVATVIVFVALLSLRRRNPWVSNAGDNLLRNVALFLALAPSGAALSLDRWRAHRARFWDHPLRAPWAVRLIQLQVSLLYLFTVWEKAKSEEWIAGTAVASTLRVRDLTRFDVPYALSESLLIGNLLAYATLAVELALAVLVWNRRARPYVLAAGVALHVFIDLAYSLGFFSAVILVSYLSFLPEDTADRAVARVRARWSSSRASAGSPVAAREPRSDQVAV